MGLLWALTLDRIWGVPTAPGGAPLFSRAALWLLNRQRFEPAAKGQFEYMSGGLSWPDEFPTESGPHAVVFRGYAFRFLLAYRASATLRQELHGSHPVWEQVARHAPNWPGLRPERRGTAALRRLRAALRRQDRCFAEFESQAEASSPEA